MRRYETPKAARRRLTEVTIDAGPHRKHSSRWDGAKGFG